MRLAYYIYFQELLRQITIDWVASYIRDLVSLFWRLKVQNEGVGRGMLSLKAVGKNLLQACFFFLSFWCFWVYTYGHSNLCLFCHMMLPQCVSVSVSPLLIRTSVTLD